MAALRRDSLNLFSYWSASSEHLTRDGDVKNRSSFPQTSDSDIFYFKLLLRCVQLSPDHKWQQNMVSQLIFFLFHKAQDTQDVLLLHLFGYQGVIGCLKRGDSVNTSSFLESSGDFQPEAPEVATQVGAA